MIFVHHKSPKRTRTELAEFVIASIETAGICLPASCRLRQMHELHLKTRGDIRPDHPDFQTALEAERDLQLLGFVFDQFGTINPSDTCLQLLNKLVNDSVLPQRDRTQSSGRNAAFELFVGAICKAADFNPVFFEEPDVTCVWESTKFGIAVKRLKSIKKLEQRIRDAVAQIGRSGLPGIIALDTCIAFNPTNDRIPDPMPDSLFMSRYWEILSKIWCQYNHKIQQIISRAQVLGIIVHDHQVRFQPDQQWSLASMTMRVAAMGRSITDQKHFESFSTLYTYALPNQEEISRPTIVLP